MKTTINLQTVAQAYDSGKDGALLEGGSRSGKTFAVCQFLVCYMIKNTGKVITVARDTRVSLEKTLLIDFHNVLRAFAIFSDVRINKSKLEYEYNGNLVRFIGLDKVENLQGLAQDLFWLNEAMNIQKAVFDQLSMRTSEFFVCDYNPTQLENWLYDLSENKNVAFKKTTVLDNPFVPEKARKAILSFEPTPENIANNTADEYYWKVFGLGERAAGDDVIFKNFETFTEWPEEYDYEGYGVDFGWTSPTAVVKIRTVGDKVYWGEILYQPELRDDELADILKAEDENGMYVCDPAQKASIEALINKGVYAFEALKGADSVSFGVKSMLGLSHYIHEDAHNIKKEFKLYRWQKDTRGNYKEKNGVRDPFRKNDHAIDAGRYCLRQLLQWQWV